MLLCRGTLSVRELNRMSTSHVGANNVIGVRVARFVVSNYLIRACICANLTMRFDPKPTFFYLYGIVSAYVCLFMAFDELTGSSSS